MSLADHELSIAPLHLLVPEDLPEEWDAFLPLPASVLTALKGVLTAILEKEKLHHLRKAAMALQVGPWEEVRSHKTSMDRADAMDHDRYFHVVRVRGDSRRIYVSGIVQVYLGLIEDLISEVSSTPIGDRIYLYTALDTILSATMGASGIRRTTVDNAIRGMRPVVGLRRWIRGHQVFLVIIQGLIREYLCLFRALGDGHPDGVREGFDRMAALLKGSAAALRFTADFSAVDYNEVVRPSMMPPVAPAGMSGVLSSDHAQLIKLISTLKGKLAALDPDCVSAYCGFRDALSDTYDAHLFVCERFTGREKPSLLTVLTAETAAVEALDRFKRNRLGLLPESVGCERDRGIRPDGRLRGNS